MSNTAPSRADPVVVFPLGRWCPPQETSQPHPPPPITQTKSHQGDCPGRHRGCWSLCSTSAVMPRAVIPMIIVSVMNYADCFCFVLFCCHLVLVNFTQIHHWQYQRFSFLPKFIRVILLPWWHMASLGLNELMNQERFWPPTRTDRK